MIKNAIYTTLLTILSLMTLGGCQDDYFDSINGVNGDGTGGVTLTVDFQPLAGAEMQSRATINHTTGNLISGINDMCIVMFDEEGAFVELIDVIKGMYTDTENYDRVDADASNGELAGETGTTRREIRLNKMSVGKFYMYAVANLGTYTTGATKSTRQYLEEVNVSSMTRETFRTMRRTWDPSNYRNNSEMSGIFTIGERAGTEAFTGAEENPVSIYPGVNLHCWLRRLASKVTVDFDASGLNPSTTVFIKEIRVRDIPYDCKLLEANTASAEVETEGGLMANSRSSHGIQTCVNLDADAESSHGSQWLALTSGCPTIEKFIATCSNAQLKTQLANISHANDAKSIFFYENMQGDGESKRQDAEGGGYETDADGNKIPLPDGFIDSPDSTDPNDPHYKDGKRGGTYVEVIGYYESYDQGNEGSGNIIYRFMLGKDAESNYDVERNHHYKLTLCFNGYANDYDWHIEYDRSQPPVTIPDEYYVSYGYNEKTEFPINISGDIIDDRIMVEIVRNDWFPSNTWKDTRPSPMGIVERGVYFNPSEATRANAADPENLSVGFLSLRRTHSSAAGAGKDVHYLYDLWMGGGESPDYVRNAHLGDDIYGSSFIPDEFAKYRNKRPLGFRAFKFDGITEGFSGEIEYDEKGNGPYKPYAGNAKTADGSYRMWTKAGTANTPRQTTVYIPLFTRNRNLVKTTGYTGENPYNVFQRRAAIRVKFSVRDHKNRVTQVDTIIPIIQATKLANPMAIWREWNNAAPFDVHLKYLDGRDAETYTVLTSHNGGWSAEVEQGAEWILLNGGKRKIYGGENSEIRFTYRPAGILSGPNQTRCGVIVVRYHNYSCIHRIYVRQGMAPLQVHAGKGPYWHSYNLVTANTEGISPTDEGSLFKFLNLNQPIDAVNNVNDKKPWLMITPNMWEDHTDDELVIAGKKGDESRKKWGDITSVTSTPATGDGWPDITLKDGSAARLPQVSEVVDLRDDPETVYQFGVLYGNDATRTGDNIDEAYRYKAGDRSTYGYGMRGCIIFSEKTANQIFLPIGSSGYGKRKERRSTMITAGKVDLTYGWGYREVGRGIVRYSTSRISYMPKDNAKDSPLLYDIFKSFGANYWCKTIAKGDSLAKDDYGQKIDRSSIDFNYNTFDFFTFGTEPFDGTKVGHGSDALFIRLVQDNP